MQYIYMQYIYTYIHFPCEILLLCNIECCKYTYSLWNIAISHSRMQKIYIFLMKYRYFAFSNAGNIHNPYEILLFCNIECQKYTFSLCKNHILQSGMLKISIFLMKYWHFAISNAENIHFPYEILTFWPPKCTPGGRLEAARKPCRPGPSRVQKIV